MKNRPLCSVCLLFCLMLCIATVCGGEKLVKELRPSSAEVRLQGGEKVIAAGKVYKKADKEKYQVLYLKNNSITYHQLSLKESRLIIYDENKQNIGIGDFLTAQGEIGFFENARNPGNFDSKLYYQKQDIHANIWAESIQRKKKSPHTPYEDLKNMLYQFRQKWKDVLCESLGEEEGNTLSAMLLGEKAQMDEELRELYQVNGIGHVLAISGLHLSFIGIGMYKVIRRLTGSYPVGGLFGILFLMLYILMIGFTVSAVRALTMFLFRVGADMAGRHYDAPTALSVAAVVALVWQPLSLYDGGFWLSFGAVFAILAVAPVVQAIFSRTETTSPARSSFVYLRGVWEHIWQMILQGLVASIGINLVIFPILLYYFFEFPLYSFILNLFVLPLMSVLLFLGMAGSLFTLWLVPASAILFRMCGRILWVYKMNCEIALRLPGARLVIGRPKMWQIMVYYGILFLGLILLRYIVSMKEQDKQGEEGGQDFQRYGKNLRFIQSDKSDKSVSFNNRISGRTGRNVWKEWSVVFLWAVGVMILTTRFGETGKLTTVVMDVGQGDGIFMKGPEGNTYLVDGGSSDVKKVGQYRMESFLKSQGVGTLDYVMISHGDGDHMNGIEELIERQDIGVKIRTLVLPVQEVWDEALAGLAKKAKDYGIRVAVIEPGQSIREGDMSVTCIQPGNKGIKSEDDGLRQKDDVSGADSEGLESGNGASMILAVQYGKFDMLLTGDVEGEGEKQLTKRLEESYQNCMWEVVKVAHHGSKNSSTEEFLQQIRSAYALISAGQENRYGHPHKETIKRLADIGCKTYSTQENGAIIVEVEGGEILRMQKWQR